MDQFVSIFHEFLALVPIVAVAAPIVAAVVELLKKFAVPDGYAGVTSGLLNVAFWLALAIASHYGARDEAEGIITLLAQIAPVMVALVTSVAGSKVFHMLFDWTGSLGQA